MQGRITKRKQWPARQERQVLKIAELDKIVEMKY